MTRTKPDMRLRPGDGVLVRHEDVVLLCELPPDAEDSVRAILDEVKAAAGAEQPGRHLVRHLVRTLAASAGGFPSLCAFGAVEGGIAVAVHGKARLLVTTMDGELRLDGQDAVTIVDRVVAEPVLSITAEIGEGPPGFCPWSELTSGVVRANALRYGSFVEPMPDPMAESMSDSMADSMSGSMAGSMADPMPGSVPEPRSESMPEARSESVPEARSESTPMTEPAFELMPMPDPMPDASVADDPAPQGESDASDDGSRVLGATCAKGHFNDPTNQYCAVCGIGLTQAGRRSVQQVRPTLGVLVLDDGTSLPITKDYVIGQAPETASDVGNGDVTLLRLKDPLVSGVHASVRLDGWEVGLIDEGSTNGTFLREPGGQQWTRVPSGGRVVLRPGAIVAVGGRQFRYDSYRRQ